MSLSFQQHGSRNRGRCTLEPSECRGKGLKELSGKDDSWGSTSAALRVSGLSNFLLHLGINDQLLSQEFLWSAPADFIALVLNSLVSEYGEIYLKILD